MSLVLCCRSKTNFMLFPAFAAAGIFHAVFTRHGGVSPAPWNSLNVSFGVGDGPDNVMANLGKIKEVLGFEKLISAVQVHGSRVHVVAGEPAADLTVEGYDALITDIAGIGLMVKQADCQAILLHDPVRKAVGIIHAGWRGSAANIIGATVAAMTGAFNSNPAEIKAAVSPSLGPCCAEFVNYRQELPSFAHAYRVKKNYFDFWALSRDQLGRAGLEPDNIVTAALCTVCTPAFFSYRRQKLCGRFASVIGIRK